MSEFYTDLENRLSKVNAPAMPADVESRIRQRLSVQTGKRRRRPLIGFLTPTPAFAAQLALLAALAAIATALFAHDATLSGAGANPPAGVSAGAPNYVVTFSVPTVKSNAGPAEVSHTIAPPLPPRKHH